MPEFGPRELLNCYANGIFPMSDGPDSDELFLVDPKHRAVFPLGSLKISKSLAKTVRTGRFDVKVNTAFTDVVLACADPGRIGSWINEPIIDLYTQLHDIGHAHSVECWQGGALVGGLYGVSLRGAFFGESMFSRARDASKTALVHLAGRLIAGGFVLLDAQFMTKHLRTLGAVEISRDEYHERLANALGHEGNFTPEGYCDLDFRKSVTASSSRTGTTQSSTQIS